MGILKEKTQGNLIVVSGPSGSGKNSIVTNLHKYNNNFWESISMTTREKRPGEKDNIDYYFISKEEFLKNIEDGNLLEYTNYNGFYYGTPKSHIMEKLNAGIDVILVIEIECAINVKELIPDTICIFILPPSMKELKRRLISRNTENKDKIIKRFTTAYKEINEITKYNYVIVNDNLDEATITLNSILISERSRVDRIEDIHLGNMEEEIHELLIDKDLDNTDRNIA